MARNLIARSWRLAAILLAGASVTACVTPRYATAPSGPSPSGGAGGYKVGKPYQVKGVWYVPHEQPDYDETGVASWYGDAFHLKATANGELFDMGAVSAAHTTLPLPSVVEVTNLDNGRKLKVRVNDRGPFVGDRIIDLSREAARQLGFERQGLARVRVRYIGPAPLKAAEPRLTYAKAETPKPPKPASGEPLRLAAAVAPPAPVSASALPPLVGSALPDLRRATGQSAGGEGPPTDAASEAFRVQAGAFSSELNAQRAVEQLAGAGQAFIEPLERDGRRLYRVLLAAPADEAQAYALRDRVAEIGFADARVLSSF